MQELNIANVQTLLLKSPEHIKTMGLFDFFYSVIVLQHNPPPIQKLLLTNTFSQIRAGGACLFQTPSSLPGYSFSIDDFLDSSAQEMDMHCLPKPIVLQLLSEFGLRIRDVEPDGWTGMVGSYTYFATKTH